MERPGIGRALVQWHDFWVYVAGPLIGAPLGALAYQYLRGEPPQRPILTSDPQEKADGHRAVRLPA